MTDVDLAALAKQFRGAKLAELILKHVKAGPEQCTQAFVEMTGELPTTLSSGVTELIDVVNGTAMQDGNAFFADDLAKKLDDLIRVSRGFFRKRYATEITDEQAFTLFNILVLNFAYGCFKNPSTKGAMQKAAGKGFLRRAFG